MLRFQCGEYFSIELHLPIHASRRFDIVISDAQFAENTSSIDDTVVSPRNRSLLPHAAQTTGGATNEAEGLMIVSKR